MTFFIFLDKTNLPGTWYHVFIPPTPYSSRISSYLVSYFEKIYMFCYHKKKKKILNVIWFFVYYFPKRNRSRLLATAGCSALRLFGMLCGDVYMYVFVLAFGAAISGHAGV